MKFHKIYFAALILAVMVGMTSCEEKEKIDYGTMAAPDIQLVADELPSAAFGSVIQVEGKVISEVGVRDIAYILKKKAGSSYEPIGTEKYFPLPSLDKEVTFSIPVTIEDDEIAAVEVIATDVVTKSTSTLFVIKSVTGIPTGGAWVFNNIEMAPEYERPVNPVQPYLFSSTGVSVNGTLKHVLTLQEAKSTSTRGIDFAFINMWKNTLTNPPSASSRLGNRGFAFCDVSQLSRGPIGRQCDNDWIPVRDTTCMYLVSDNIAATANFDALFANAADNWKTYKALNQIPELFPTWKVGTNYYVAHRNGGSADNTTACSINLKKGSYIVFRRQNNLDFKYGIIKIEEMANDADALNETGCKIVGDDYTQWYTGPGIPGLTYNGVGKLYGRKVKLKIVVQK